jgi:hypothetical protein
MRRAGREDWKRIASLALVALIATFSLPLGASATHSIGPEAHRPAERVQVQRLQLEARPVAVRRPFFEQLATLPLAPFVLAALVVVAIVVLSGATRLAWSPGLAPVSRGPPSLR